MTETHYFQWRALVTLFDANPWYLSGPKTRTLNLNLSKAFRLVYTEHQILPGHDAGLSNNVDIIQYD